MKDMQMFIELLDSPIAFNPAFARVVGNNLAAGMLLSQLFYWAKIMNFEEFYKISDELQEECFLGRTEFENARKKILDTGIVTLVKKGVPCKSFYKINLGILFDLLCKLDCMKPANKPAENQQTIINNREYTETTTENNTNKKIIKNEVFKKNYKSCKLELTPESEEQNIFCDNPDRVDKKNDVLFDDNGFNETDKVAINNWLNYHRELKKPYKTKSGVTALRNKMLELAKNGLLIEAVNHSMAMGYTGLFPPNTKRYMPPNNNSPSLSSVIKNCNSQDFSSEEF